MNRILILISVIILAGGAIYVLTRDTTGDQQVAEATPTPTATAAATATPSSSSANPSATPAAKGAYISYSAESIAATPGTKILFFHASWCPQCRALEKSIQEGSIPDGVTIMKVDYDSNQALRKKYGVTVQTSLVRVDDAGNLVERYVASEKPNLQAVLDNLL